MTIMEEDNLTTTIEEEIDTTTDTTDKVKIIRWFKPTELVWTMVLYLRELLEELDYQDP